MEHGNRVFFVFITPTINHHRMAIYTGHESASGISYITDNYFHKGISLWVQASKNKYQVGVTAKLSAKLLKRKLILEHVVFRFILQNI